MTNPATFVIQLTHDGMHRREQIALTYFLLLPETQLLTQLIHEEQLEIAPLPYCLKQSVALERAWVVD